VAESSNTTLLNFVGGEISQYMAARTDLEAYLKSMSWCQNWIVLPQGGLRYRPGTYLTGLTKSNLTGAIIPFQFSASDAQVIVATNTVFRFYRNDAVILNASNTITGATAANPCVITSASHGFSNGQEVYVSGIAGMTQLDNRFFLVASATTNTFALHDQFGNAVDSSTYSAYVSGGTVASIYELTTPYLAADLPYLRVAQVGDVMYICCANPVTGAVYPPYKLTRSGFTSWALALVTWTNSPFTPTSFAITGVSQASPAVVTVSSTTGMTTGDIMYVTGVVGMTQLNGNFYQVTKINSTTFSLADLNGNAINSTGYGAWSSAGTFYETNLWPATCAFTGDGRFLYANTKQNPSGWWASELPSGASSNFDNFTTGSTAANAMIYALAPVNGIIDNIQDVIQFSGNLEFLNASTIELAFGASPGDPPTPLAIGTQPTYQGAFNARAIVVNWDLIFIDINQAKLRGMQYNLAFNDYQAIDYTLAAQHLGEESQFIKMVCTKSNPELIWILRADGALLAFTFNNIEKVQAWSRCYLGGSGKVLDIGRIRNSSGNDELWMLVQRTIGSNTVVSVEVLSQWPIFPALRKFYTNAQNQLSDLANWQNAAWEAGKTGNFLDMSLTYNGRARGIAAAATITPSDTFGNITITASQSVFLPTDVGQQIWVDYNSEGVGGGQAVITGYTSATVVTATVIGALESTAVVAAGAWGFAVNSLVNLQMFEGQLMSVQTDGAGHPSQTVTGGKINLLWFAEVIQVGYGYVGLAASQNIAPQSKLGPTHSKPRNIKKVRARFTEAIGAQIGTSEYTLQQVVFRQSNQIANRCPPPFTGLKVLAMLDPTTDDTKQVVVVQTEPTPCTISALDVEIVTSDPP